MPSIVGGFDIHRKQLSFHSLDTVSGQLTRGQLTPADRGHLRAWLARLQNPQDAAFAAEACTGWRYVAEELQRAGTTAPDHPYYAAVKTAPGASAPRSPRPARSSGRPATSLPNSATTRSPSCDRHQWCGPMAGRAP